MYRQSPSRLRLGQRRPAIGVLPVLHRAAASASRAWRRWARCCSRSGATARRSMPARSPGVGRSVRRLGTAAAGAVGADPGARLRAVRPADRRSTSRPPSTSRCSWCGSESTRGCAASPSGFVVNVGFFLMFEVWFKVPLFKGAFDPLWWLGLLSTPPSAPTIRHASPDERSPWLNYPPCSTASRSCSRRSTCC